MNLELTRSVSTASMASFGWLALAVLCLWLPRAIAWRHAASVWILPGVLALVFAFAGGLVDGRGLLILLTLAAACFAARRARATPVRLLALVVMSVLCAGLFLHWLPGFDNPRVLDGVVLSPGSAPYTKYLNFDKGMAALLLLGLHAPDRPASDDGLQHAAGFLWRFLLLGVAAMAVAVASGYVRWDPKLPSWWALWTWSMVVLTAFPEEAAFRGVIQTSIARRYQSAPSTLPVVVAGLLFGLAHLAGGPLYVVLASLAGIGYGWIYSSTRSIAAAILAHAGLNTLHFLFFTYPMLAATAFGPAVPTRIPEAHLLISP